jgi:hypothetical protein
LLKHHYIGSPGLLITSVFPEYYLLPWKFVKLQSNYWSSVENQRKFMEWAAKELNIKKPSDWYSITSEVRTFLGIF